MLRCNAPEREIHLDASLPSALNGVVLDPLVTLEQLSASKRPLQCQEYSRISNLLSVCSFDNRYQADRSWDKMMDF
jgi:hypothetical protein